MARRVTELTEDEFRIWTQKRLKNLEGLIDDLFEKLDATDDRYRELTDEAIEHSARAQRAVNRIKKALEAHEEDHDE